MIKDLMTQSWEDISDVDREKFTVFLGIAPILFFGEETWRTAGRWPAP